MLLLLLLLLLSELETDCVREGERARKERWKSRSPFLFFVCS